MSDHESNQRPRRSRRQRPCDRCRSRKTACVLPAGRPCRSCDRAGMPCTFVKKPTTRVRNRAQASAPAESSDEFNTTETTFAHGSGGQEQDVYDVSHSESTAALPGPVVPTIETTETIQPPMWTFLPGSRTGQSSSFSPLDATTYESSTATTNQGQGQGQDHGGVSQDHTFDFLHPPQVDLYNSGIQHVRSIETLDEFNVQLCGTSAELDPWLLRHCKFDHVGMRSYGKIRLRNVGGVPVHKLDPVHFTVVDDAFYEPPLQKHVKSPDARRKDLNALVPPELGLQLISLYFKFVFPELPIVSRQRSDLLTSNPADGFPGYPIPLLAAIYASAFPFCVHEPSLQLSTAFDGSPVDALWNMVCDLIKENVHRPKLAVVQSALLFMHRLPRGRAQALNDSPEIMSFWSSILGLATALGLHLDCRRWGIPAWEKRLRRRMWWAIYVEDTWRSFLSGRPCFIHPSEWDTSELDELDFAHSLPRSPGSGRVPGSAVTIGRGCVFPHIARLTLLVSEIYQTFYTLKASQNLSRDFSSSLELAKPLRARLQSWYANLPEDYRINTNNPHLNRGPGTSDARPGIAIVQFCYLTTEVLLCRAILRTIAPSPPVAIITGDDEDEDEGEGEAADQSNQDFLSFIDSASWDDLLSNSYDLGQHPEANTMADPGPALETTLNLAEKCGALVTQFVNGLEHDDFDALWYGWIRLCLAAMSNFIILLRVQAPNGSRAAKAESLWKLWLKSLQRQHKNDSALFMLALVRLNSWPLDDFDSFFNMPLKMS